jgi:hypothetical protein
MDITVGEPTLVRREQAVVVAGCFMVEQKTAGLRTLAARQLRPQPSNRVEPRFALMSLRRFLPSRRVRAAAYKVGPWRRFREITLKSLHDDHTARLAW